MTTDNLLESAIPEKFKDSETGGVRLDLLLKSYNDLEKRLSRAPAPPKSPDDYCIDCAHGLFDPDKDINRRLHAKGFTQDQVQEVYDLAAEVMVPMISSMAADYQADREIERLLAHFGGEEKWREISRQLLAFGRKNLPEDVLDALASSHEGVLALHRMMKGDAPSVAPRGGSTQAGEMDLQAMMRDPKYWRDRDPSFIAKVTEGFERMYGKSS